MKVHNIIFSVLVIIIVVITLLYKKNMQKPMNIHNKQDVQIQILSKDQHDIHSATETDIEVIAQSIDEDEESFCQKGDIECMKNLSFFNNTYYSGILNQNDMNMMDVDQHDNENDIM